MGRTGMGLADQCAASPGIRGNDCSNAMAAAFSATALGLHDLETGTSNVRCCQST
jgi:hypothetical protein